MKAIFVETPGGPEQLRYLDSPDPVPGAGEVLVGVTIAGVNFMDTGVRRGMLPTLFPMPMILGVEGCGRVLAVGEGVDALKVGQRVAWVYAHKSYAERVVVSAENLVPVPDAIDDSTAAALMMQGITASHFANQFYAVQAGDVALVHAAAGGVGLLLTQMIKMRGGTVIGRVSSEDKADIAREAGADHVVVDTEGKFADEVRRLSGGEGVKVVYDGSGPKTFQDSLASLRRHGVFAWFGPVLGGPGPIEIMSLPKSILIGYPSFFDHVPDRASLLARSTQLFDWAAAGTLKVRIGKTYPLADAAQAHADMDSRKSIGKLLLAV